MEQLEEKKNNSAMKAGLILAVALAAIFGFLYFNARQEIDSKTVDISSKTKELLMTNSKLDSISSQLDAKIAEVTALGGQVADLEALRDQLEKDKKNLINSKNVSIRDFENKIKGYEAALSAKDAEIAKLRAENAQLTTEVKTLGSENTTLKSDVATLKTDKKALSDSVYSTTVRNRELSEKVTLAAALKAVNISVNAINSRGKEREGGEYKAKRVDKVKVSFKLAENPLTKQENKVIYMRILDPQGNCISDMATGSGAFSFGGKEMIYTTKQNVMYDNSGQNIDFVYSRGASYSKGRYAIELYSEGFSIGRGSFEVK